MNNGINICTVNHLEKYGKIFADAFSGEPWNEHWSLNDATTHVRELIDSKQSYGLEYLVDGRVAGFILGTSMLFSYGRTFEINDLAVAPEYQGQGIASKLLARCLSDMKKKGVVSFHLITASRGKLPSFYGKFGFKKEERVILMGLENIKGEEANHE